eukprot:204260-Pelagomonas_calceolata.AAC.2
MLGLLLQHASPGPPQVFVLSGTATANQSWNEESARSPGSRKAANGFPSRNLFSLLQACWRKKRGRKRLFMIC